MAERDLIASVIQLSNLLTRRLAPIFEKARVTPQQWAVLSALASADAPMTLAGLARTMLVSKQNMTGMVARLQDLGLAERSDDPTDLRSSRVQLTRRGRALVEKFRPSYDEWRAALGKEVSEREMAGLARALDRLISELQ